MFSSKNVFLNLMCYNCIVKTKERWSLVMAGNSIICVTNKVEYIQIRQAMCQNARTKEELKDKAGVCLMCEGCRENLDWILTSVCGCKKTSLASVVSAVKAGAKTVEAVGVATGAGTDCGRCQILIENIIDIGR